MRAAVSQAIMGSSSRLRLDQGKAAKAAKVEKAANEKPMKKAAKAEKISAHHF